jgi:hypothetical protein
MLAIDEHGGDEDLRGSGRRSVTPRAILFCIAVESLKASVVPLVALGLA